MSEPTLSAEQQDVLAEFRSLGAAIHLFRCSNPDCRHYDDESYFTPRDNDAASAVLASGWLADRIAKAEQRGRAEVTAAVEALLDQVMRVSPRDFDAKTNRPEFAHERCKQPNCSLRPWGLGTVTRDEPRYCPYHQALDEARAALRAALADPAAHVAAIKAEAWDEGYRSGLSNAMRRMSDEPDAPTTPNPYRIGGSR